jgi:hypothetical protein
MISPTVGLAFAWTLASPQVAQYVVEKVEM